MTMKGKTIRGLLLQCVESVTYWPGLEVLYVRLVADPGDVSPIVRLGSRLSRELKEIRLSYYGDGYAVLERRSNGRWGIQKAFLEEGQREELERLLGEA
jgi:hypothetical protein